MSFKAKDLHYEKQEPAFLRRIKGAYDANDGRSNVQIARPKKSRLKTGDGDEDEPLILDENGDVVGQKEFDGMVKGEVMNKPDDGTVVASTNGARVEDDKREEKQQLVGIGSGRKRKQVKAIAAGSDDEVETMQKRDAAPTTKQVKAANNTSKKEESSSTKPSTNKLKKKAKKIKLSFDEPE